MADKISLPRSGGGLVNYKEDYKSFFTFSPYIVVVLIVLIIIVEYLLHKVF